MIGVGQPLSKDNHTPHALASFLSPPAHAVAHALPPIADLDYHFRFSGGNGGSSGGVLQVGTAGVQAVTPDFCFNADYGMGAVGMGSDFCRGAGGDDGVQWGCLGIGSPSKDRSTPTANDSTLHDDVYRLLGSIGRLSPLIQQGGLGRPVSSLSISQEQAHGVHSEAGFSHALHPRRPESQSHGSELLTTLGMRTPFAFLSIIVSDNLCS